MPKKNNAVVIEGKSTIQILEQIVLFAGMSQQHLRRIANIGFELQTAAGETVFEEGQKGDTFYIVLKGSVRVSRLISDTEEEALAVFESGAYFGEMSLLDSAPRSATAIANQDLTTFCLSRKDLDDLLFVDRDLAYELLWNFVRTLSSRLRASNDKMTLFAICDQY